MTVTESVDSRPPNRRTPVAAALRTGALATSILVAAVIATARAEEQEPAADGAPIRMSWIEGDAANFNAIFSPDDSKPIGIIEFRQHLRGDTLELRRVARFHDGSSDEDSAEARVGEALVPLRGRTILRNAQGVATADLSIDVAARRVWGFAGLGDERQNFNERIELPANAYWGPLIFLVLKNFDANANDDHLVFRTVIPTPKPRVLSLEVIRQEKSTVMKAGAPVDATRYLVRPTVNWLIDPFLRILGSNSNFYVQDGSPPSFVRFIGARNYAGQTIRIE